MIRKVPLKRTGIKRSPVKPKKAKRSTLSNRADKLWSLKIREKGYCEAAGKDGITCSGNLQGCHIFGRRYRATRWDLRNGLCMCAAHHYWYTGRPELWYSFINWNYPDRWDELAAKIMVPWDKDYDKVMEGLA